MAVTFEILQTNNLAATFESTNVNCNAAADGVITITAMEGASPFEYAVNAVLIKQEMYSLIWGPVFIV